MIFVSGVHGVGKTYFCNLIYSQLDIPFYTASELISKGKEEVFNKNKLIKDIGDNQHYLLDALKNLDELEKKYILDGHFCLLDRMGKVTRIPINTFRLLHLDAIILLTEAPEVIAHRRMQRDGIKINLESISTFQKEECRYAMEVAEQFSVKLFISHGEFEISKAISFIDSL